MNFDHLNCRTSEKIRTQFLVVKPPVLNWKKLWWNHRETMKLPSVTRKDLLEAYNQIDIALDPFPFQGNTSTIESVWMGVPVITLKGNRYLFHFG